MTAARRGRKLAAMTERSPRSEIDALHALLASRPRPASLVERRKRLDTIAVPAPGLDDVVHAPVDAGGVAAEWSTAPEADHGRVLLYLHGGGYCSGSIASHRGLAAAAGRAAGARTLSVGYRLAPEHPFPAALEDALAAYRFLLAGGVAPGRIAVAGDSAGGGLSLALALGLREAGEPLPACLWLISPWVDLAFTGRTLETKSAVDPILSRPYLEWLAEKYLADANPKGPLVSPLYADLAGLPPTLIQVGAAETLLDDAVRLACRAGAADVPVTLEIWPEMVHVWHMWAGMLAAGRRAIAAGGAFAAARLQGGDESSRPSSAL